MLRGRKMKYILIAATIALTVSGQLLIKAGMLDVGAWPSSMGSIGPFLWHALRNPRVIAGLAAAVLAAFAWMGVVSLSDISLAYPFMALNIVLVLALAGWVFAEHVPLNRWFGVAIVCIGLIVATR
jgi:drug/metabolite transporter (DMT)-like permease